MSWATLWQVLVRSGALALLCALAPACLAADEAPPAKSPPAAVRQFRDAAAFQDRGVYDLAADEWEKFLKQFPGDPLSGKVYHYLGLCRLLLKQYDQALSTFQHTIKTYPKSELADASYLNLGLTQYSIAQAGKPEAYDEAAATLTTLIARFPQSKQLGEAYYYLGESLYARGKRQPAADAYAQAIARLPAGPLRADTLYALGVTRQDLGKPLEAGAAYDQFLKEFPQHALTAEVGMRRGETLFTLREFAAAQQKFHAAAAAKDFKLADLATMREAASLFEQQKVAEAAALYATIAERFPNSTERTASILAAGNCYYLAGDFDAARRWLTAALPAGGDTAGEAAHWLARIALKAKQPAEALKVVEQALPMARKFAVNLKMDRADALFELPDRQSEAIAVYAALAKENPTHALAPQALYMAAFAALGQADYAAAQNYCQQFLTAYATQPLAVDVRYVAAEAALQLKQYAEAEQLYRDLAEKNPQHADADNWRVRRGLALFLDKKYPAVIEALFGVIPALKTAPLAAQANALQGNAQLELKQYESAIKSLEASLAADSKGRDADETLLNLASAYRQLNKLPEAIAALRRIPAEVPESKLLDRAYYRLGEYAVAAGDNDAAAADYARVVKDWPASPLVPHSQYGLAWTQLARKDYAGANTTLSTLLDQHPAESLAAKAHYARATAREQLKDYAGGQADAQAFLATNPPANERLEATYLQGLCASGLNQFDQAAELFRAVLASDAKTTGRDKVLYELAWALKSGGKADEARDAFERLAREQSDSPLAAESLFHVAESFYQAKDYSRAAENYQMAAAKAGASELGEKAAHKLAWTRYQQGQFEAAAAAFAAQLAAFPQGDLASDGQWMEAESLFSQKKYEAAREAYQKSLDRLPANPQFRALALLHAGQTLAQLKQWEPSFSALERGLKDDADKAYRPELLYESAWALQNLGRKDEAATRYEQVATDNDREIAARARFMIGEILFEKQDYKEAVRNFFKVAYGFGYPKSPETMHPWQASSAYEAARCFEALRMFDQARKAYHEVVDKYPNSDKTPLAESRLKALGP